MGTDEPVTTLSVLIPSIPRRQDKLAGLLEALEKQAQADLEVLVLMDNCRRPLGTKRNELMQLARGKFVCHIDDDEMISDDFAAKLLPLLRSCHEETDLVAYDAKVTIDGGTPFRVRTYMDYPVDPVQLREDGTYGDIRRPPWHWCAWRRELAVDFEFPTKYYGEDWAWLVQVTPNVRRWEKIDEMLFHHRFSSKDSSASNEFVDETNPE